ncbi:MAG: Chemotaxis response regulator protein-glutamate methylesterase [Anaerolineae bacterium]|nr:Chemotaxis response regulator protein-glutamate methylesterase [Anaerolineae bacterium]
MDLMTLGLLGLLLLGFILLLAVVLLRRRRRRAGKAQPKKTSAKSEAKKAPPKQVAPKKQAPADGKTPPPAKPADNSTKILGGPTEQQRALPAQPKLAYAPAGEKIRILIVDDNTGTRENVSRLLYFEDDLEVIGQAVNGRQGVEMAIALKPHIVLMDINMPDMDGITATHEMATKSPFSQVIIMSVQADQHYMRRAMAAGARDFQPKPFTSEELVSCIRRVYSIGLPIYQQYEAIEKAKTEDKAKAKQADKPERTESPIIAVYSPKGGTGVSAIAVNLAVAVHQALGDTVLMDGALQFGDVSVHLDTRPTRSIIDMIHDGQMEADLLDDVLLPHNSGLKLLMAPPQPELAESVSNSMVPEVLATLKKQFNAVVVDTICHLTHHTLSIFDAADCVLVLLTPELPAIKSAKLFLELTEQLHFKDKHIFVVINRSDFPGGIQPRQIQKVLKLEQTYQIPHDPRIVNALARGAPVVLSDSAAPSAVAIQALAKAVLDALAVSQGEPEGVS